MQIKMRKIWFVFPTLNRYQAARYKACLGAGLEAGVFEVSKLGSYPIPGWRSPEADSLPDIVTLFDDRFFGDTSSRELKERLVLALDGRQAQIGALALLGWGNREANIAHGWALRKGIACILMSESTEQDRVRNPLGESVKRQLVRGFDSAVVGGRKHAAYLERLGMPVSRIAYGYNAVDNDFFARGARAAADTCSRERRLELGPGAPYWLCACRMVPVKNLRFLLHAYADYRTKACGTAVQSGPAPAPGAGVAGATTRSPWDLVILGDGPEREALLALRSQLGLDHCVHMPGFKTYDEMPAYYGLASGFVLPSISEPWGLVVNEAMACGLPVLVSNRCGAAELVEEGVSGYTFDPSNVHQLGKLLLEIGALPYNQRMQLGQLGRAAIAEWGPGRFAAGLREAVANAQVARGVIARSVLTMLLRLRVTLTSSVGYIQ